jgi:hypothetical protein
VASRHFCTLFWTQYLRCRMTLYVSMCGTPLAMRRNISVAFGRYLVRITPTGIDCLFVSEHISVL